MVRASYSRSRCRGFDFQPVRYQAVTLGKFKIIVYTHVLLSPSTVQFGSGQKVGRPLQ